MKNKIKINVKFLNRNLFFFNYILLYIITYVI